MQKKKFLTYHSALLFTLWWVDDDEAARERLISEFSNSIEAAAVRGHVTIQPSAFWYLMPRTTKNVLNSAQISPQPTQQRTKPLYYQIGFYKNKQYADKLMDDLRSKNFIPRIKEETRASGTVYYLVFVEENETYSIGRKLKSAGYEAFPVSPQ